MVSMAVNNGIALGGGAELCWSCNLRVAGESAVFGQVETIVGDIPGAGGTVRLPRLAGKAVAMEMVLSGRPVQAQRLLELGVINRVFPDETLRQDAIEFAKLFAKNPAPGLREGKRSINEGFDLPLKEALRNETKITRAMDKNSVIDVMRRIVADYDAGKDSFEVYGFPELRPSNRK
jgi:enoyl-CoA hydratase/carnithine racemase